MMQKPRGARAAEGGCMLDAGNDESMTSSSPEGFLRATVAALSRRTAQARCICLSTALSGWEEMGRVI
jgi:hypothetical protein